MRLSYADAVTIESCRKLVKGWERGLINESELFRPLFDALSRCSTDDGVRQCIANLSERMFSRLQKEFDKIRTRSHPGDLLVHAPNTPGPQELEILDARATHLLNIVDDYLQNPTGPVDFDVDHEAHRLAVLHQSWQTLLDSETVLGKTCRTENCSKDRMRYSVFCHMHHFEVIYGEPPPET